MVLVLIWNVLRIVIRRNLIFDLTKYLNEKANSGPGFAFSIIVILSFIHLVMAAKFDSVLATSNSLKTKKYVFKRAAAAATWHFDIRRHASAIVNAEHVPGCFITAVVEVWLPGCRGWAGGGGGGLH